jgi:putative phosphoesterase
VRVAIIADTHLPRGSRRLSEPCLQIITTCDLLIHAGDIATAAVLQMLGQIGPAVLAVHGNVDEPALRTELPESLTLELQGLTVAVVHDAGPARGRPERLRARFPSAALVIFGHSHLPLHETAADGLQIFNPGSPTERRRAPFHTMGVASIDGARAVLEHLAV